MQDDNSLMESFQAGDRESFEKLIVKNMNRAVFFAQKYVHNYHTAEDIVQESFADIYVHRQRYKSKYSFKTYLFTIIKNKCIDQLRKKQHSSFEDIGEAETGPLEQSVLENERRGMVRQAVNKLKEDYRLAIYLVEYEGFSYEEAAQIMGRNLGQIKILIYRAKKKLKTMLENEV